MHDNFDAVLAVTLKFEGGYVDNKFDPGGATNMGITLKTLEQHRRRPVSKAEVMALSRAEAAEIYAKTYWHVIGGDDLPPGVDMALFDYAVNSGTSRAIRALQSALGIAPDGALGPTTLAAVKTKPVESLIRKLCAARQGFLQHLTTFRVFGRGWSARIAAVETAALHMAQTQLGQTCPQPQNPA